MSLKMDSMQDRPQPFELVTSYQPAGDQPQAIEKLSNGLKGNSKNLNT